jgi:signal transduction histidine kinase/CheY-like chemotaxis protein
MGAQGEPPGHRTGMRRRLIQVGVCAMFAALLPLVLLAGLTSTKAQQVVRREVAARLDLAASLSASLVSAQLSTAVTLVEAEARRPRMVAAVGDGNPAHFDLPELTQQLVAMKASGASLEYPALVDLSGILRRSPEVPAYVGKDFSGREYYRGLVATGSTYISGGFASVVAGHPVIVSIATYIRAASRPGQAPGRPLAVLVTGVRLDEVQAVVDGVGRQQQVSLWVADRQGQLVASPGIRLSTLRPVASAPVGPAVRQAPGRLVDVGKAHPALLVIRQPISVSGWTVYAAVPRSSAYAGASSIRSTVLNLGLPLGAVVLVGILLLLRTQRRQWLAEAALEGARDEAQAASRQKSAFLANMSHELRTPMNAILGFGQLLALDGALGPEQRDEVEHIVHAGEHLLGLIDEVLDIARMERGTMRLSLEPVSVPAVLDEALAMIRPLADRREISISVTRPAGECYARADNQRLRQVVMNLLSNAVKYNERGGQVLVQCDAPAVGKVRLSITDTGPGIGPDDLARLFRPFERLTAGVGHIEGTGLGLALSRHLMSAMGGEVGVSSQPGRGSTFWVELSACDPPAEGNAPVPDDASATAPPPPVPLHRSGPGIVLYVEDNLSNVRLMERIMAHRPQLKMLVAMQGRLAIEMTLEHRPDLLLLDLHLPDMSGEQVLRELRADPRTATLPVFVLTADASSGQPARLAALGATGFLTKPFDVPLLLDVIDRLGVSSPEPDLRALPPPPTVVFLKDRDVPEAGLSMYVHDVVNLLGVTLTYCALLKRGSHDEATVAALTEIRAATTEAVALSRGLLPAGSRGDQA